MALRRRLHVVTGKGGVGKSTVAAALALAAARRGARVLALELAQPAGLARAFGVTPAATGDPIATDAGVSVACIDGAAALAEYLTRAIRLGRLLDAVFAHPLYRAFVAAAPGVPELMAIGKVRDELERRDGIRMRWDALVLDAGASGHALQLLRMPGAAARAFDSGRVHREAQRIVRALTDPNVTAVHVVATPEEMPLREAGETIAAVRALELPVGALFVNQCRDAAPAGIDAALDRIATLSVAPELGAARDAIASAARRARSWEQIQQRGIDAIERETGLPAARLPRLRPAPIGAAHAEALAAHVAEPGL